MFWKLVLLMRKLLFALLVILMNHNIGAQVVKRLAQCCGYMPSPARGDEWCCLLPRVCPWGRQVAAVADNLVAAVGSVDRVDALSKLTQVHDAWHPVFSLPHLGGGITVTMCGPTLSAVKCCLLAVGWVIARVG